ncbi:MAG: MFS transporter [Pirellulaceae bacterium]|nr:MFS transporter [Pirellulaceae bacterium]
MTAISETIAPRRAGSSPELLTRLSVMMFLQYFVQGAYLPIASVYVERSLGFTPLQVGVFISALAVGPILAPFIVGQLVDRLFATERVMAACHVVGGLLMLWLSTQTRVGPVIVLGTIYSILYVPTMMLTNALAFRHLRDSDMEFPWIRLFGTLGYIVPAYLIEFWWIRGLQGVELDRARAVALVLSGLVGIGMGLYCLTLPRTPPVGQRRDYAPGIVLSLLAKQDFLVLVVVSFLIAISHQFVIAWYSPFLRTILDSGGWGAWEQTISSVGQVCELAVLALLGLAIKRFGFKRTMLLGACAYLLRCLLFAVVFLVDLPFATRLALAAAGQALHGFCFGCFMAAGYMYVDKVAPPDVRGSMQTFYGVFVLSLGFFVGGFVSGVVGDLFTEGTGAAAVRDWPDIWFSCAAICAVCVVLFAVFFREPVRRSDADAQ